MGWDRRVVALTCVGQQHVEYEQVHAPDGDRPEVVQDGVPDRRQILGHVHGHAVVARHEDQEQNHQRLTTQKEIAR